MMQSYRTLHGSSCGANVSNELSEGCYHMTCVCDYEFCYTCGKEWKDKKATCSCPLWDEDNIIHDGLEEDDDDDDYDEEDEEDDDDYYGRDYDRHYYARDYAIDYNNNNRGHHPHHGVEGAQNFYNYN